MNKRNLGTTPFSLINLVMNQSVLDELEFLDIGGLDNGKDEEADFDFVYHLPHADIDRIVLHESISDFGTIEGFKKLDAGNSMANLEDNSRQPSAINMNRKKLSRALDPMFNGKKESIRKKFKTTLENSASRIGGSRLLSGTNANSAFHSRASFGTSMRRRKSMAPSQMSFTPSAAPSSNHRSFQKASRDFLGDEAKLPSSRGDLAAAPLIQIDGADEDIAAPMIQVTEVPNEISLQEIPVIHASSPPEFTVSDEQNDSAGGSPKGGSADASAKVSQEMIESRRTSSSRMPSDLDQDIYEDAMQQIWKEEAEKLSNFHALPLWARQRVSPKKVAIAALATVALFASYVYAITIQNLITGK